MFLKIATVLLLSFIVCVRSEEQVQQHVLSMNGREEIPQNPLSLIFVRESFDITVHFGLSFLEEIRLLKETCRSRSLQLDRLFRNQIEQMSQYQSQTQQVLESSGMSDLSDEEKQDMMISVRTAMRNLIRQQKDQRQELTKNCTRQFKEMFNNKMVSALSYGQSILNSAGIRPYVTFVNHVTNYSKRLQQGLDECIDVYSALFVNNRDGTHYSGSTSEVCMTDEVESLIEFVHEFITKATQQLKAYQQTTVSPSPTPIIEQTHAGHNNESGRHHGNHHHGNHHHGNHHHGNHHHGNHHHGNHHHGNHNHSNHHHGQGNHHGNHHHGNHHHGNHHHGNHHHGNHHHGNHHNGNHHGNHHHGNHHGNHHGDHHHGHHHPGNHHHGNNRPHDTTSSYLTKPRPSTEPHPFTEPSFDIIIDAPSAKRSHHNHNHMISVLVICSASSAVLVLAIIFVALVIMFVRSKRKGSKRAGGLSEASEEEKISQMKQSGYINPTYKFFDQVSQQK